MSKFKGKKKDRWEDLNKEWRDATLLASEQEIQKRLADAALDEARLRKAQKEDLDLKEARDRAKEANRVYADGMKESRLKYQFCHQVLRDRGKIE